MLCGKKAKCKTHRMRLVCFPSNASRPAADKAGPYPTAPCFVVGRTCSPCISCRSPCRLSSRGCDNHNLVPGSKCLGRGVLRSSLDLWLLPASAFPHTADIYFLGSHRSRPCLRCDPISEPQRQYNSPGCLNVVLGIPGPKPCILLLLLLLQPSNHS